MRYWPIVLEYIMSEADGNILGTMVVYIQRQLAVSRVLWISYSSVHSWRYGSWFRKLKLNNKLSFEQDCLKDQSIWSLMTEEKVRKDLTYQVDDIFFLGLNIVFLWLKVSFVNRFISF